MSDRLGVDPDHMATVMAFETGPCPFRPDCKNPDGAVGLIQFTSGAAHAVGTTRAKLAKMTAIEQLEYVERYFRKLKAVGRMHNLGDTYLYVFCPLGVGKPDSFVLYSKQRDEEQGVKHYAKNKGMDLNKDGTITRREAIIRVTAVRNAALTKPRLPVPSENQLPYRAASGGGGAAAAVAVGLLLLLRVHKWTHRVKLAANGK